MRSRLFTLAVALAVLLAVTAPAWAVSGGSRLVGGTVNSATSNAAFTVKLANGEATAGVTVTGLTAAVATLTIEASNDGGTTWSAVNGIVPVTGAVFTTLTTDQQFLVIVAGHSQLRLRVSSTGTGIVTIAITTSVGASADAGQVLVNTEGQKATYSFATGPITTFAASATDGLVVGGSGTKVIRVTKLQVCGTATASTTIDVLLIKRSTADSAGTPVAATGISHDSTNAAVSATVNSYTANPTLGTGVGNVDVKKLNLGTTGAQAGCLFWQFGDVNGQTIVLRGTVQQLVVNFNGVTLPTGANLDYKVEETEE